MMKVLAALSVVMLAGCSAMSPKSEIVTETFMVPSLDPGITLHVRNKHLPGDRFAPERIVLFVHGATFPSETMFDIDLPGGSWMEYAASRGFDAYIVDIRGYGESDGVMPVAFDDQEARDGFDALEWLAAQEAYEALRVTA